MVYHVNEKENKEEKKSEDRADDVFRLCKITAEE